MDVSTFQADIKIREGKVTDTVYNKYWKTIKKAIIAGKIEDDEMYWVMNSDYHMGNLEMCYGFHYLKVGDTQMFKFVI